MELETWMRWLSFIGAWLLFVGPMQQAAIELREEDEARERMHELHEKIPEPPHVSSWWWLLPPVKLILESRGRKTYKQQIRSLLTPHDMEILISYVSKARAWMYVGLGGLLIAISETVELTDKMHWSRDLIIPIIVIIALGCLSSVVRTAGQTGKKP